MQPLNPTVADDGQRYSDFNPLNTKLNPICHLLALLGAHRILHVSRIRVKCPSLHLRTTVLFLPAMMHDT